MVAFDLIIRAGRMFCQEIDYDGPGAGISKHGVESDVHFFQYGVTTALSQGDAGAGNPFLLVPDRNQIGLYPTSYD